MGLIHLYSATSTSFDGNGTPLVTAREAVVKRDEGFQLTFSIPISQNELHKRVQKEMIVSAMTPDGVNYFRIWDIDKRTTDVKVTALQLLYSLDVKQVNPFGGKQYTGTTVLQAFVNSFKSPISPYTFSSSILTLMDFYTNEEDDTSTSHNALAILNKITDNWSGELMLNGFDVRMISKLGTKTDALLYEHKNIASFSDSSSMNGIVTRIYATATYTPERDEGATEDPEPVVLTATVDSPLINQYAVIYEATAEYNDARTVNELRTEILKQYSEFNVDKPERTIDVDTNIVDGTAINFGDELVLKYLVHDVDEVIRCVGYEYDPISENYIGVTLGTLEKTFLAKVTEGISSSVSRQLDKINRDLQGIQTAANGKNRIAYGPNPVPNAIEGDLWFYHPEGRPDEVELLVYQNGLWMPAPFLTDQDRADFDQAMSEHYDAALAEIERKDAEYKEIFDDYDETVVAMDQEISDAATKAQSALEEAGISTDLAQTAKDLATTAQSSASAAIVSANQAKTDASTAVTNANQAKADASTAKTNAQTALDDAQTAITNASTAVTDAGQAKEDAQTAIAEAGQAVVSANTAKSNAQTALTDAQTALSTAKNADTRSGLAETAANTAKTNAQTALDNSSTAITNAEDAITKAGQAETSANTAKTNAQTALDNAQSALTTAGSADSKAGQAIAKANAIPTTITDIIADKNLVNGTYVDTKVDSATGAWSQELVRVEGKLDGLEIGGRNLLKGSSEEKKSSREYLVYENIAHIFDEHGVGQYTFSFDIKLDVAGDIRVYCTDTTTDLIKYHFGQRIFSATTEYKRYHMTVDVEEVTSTATRTGLAFYGTYDTGRIPSVKNVKIEKGNIASDWTPAPEDLYSQEEFKIFNAQYTQDVTGMTGRLTTVENTKLDDSTFQTFKQAEYQVTADKVASTITRVDTAEGKITTQGTAISQQATAIASKADKTLVDTLSGTVSNQGTLISQNATDISSKADSELVDDIKGTVDTHTTEISQNATDIASKASSTSVNALTGRVSTAETTISQHATAITSKASQTEVDTVKGTVSSHTTTLGQHATAISSKAESSLVNTIKDTVDTHTTDISQNATDIASKASSTSVNALTGRVSTAESNISQNATAITQRVTTTTYNTGIASKENTVLKQSTAPSHVNGRLWLDTSATPNILKRSTGSAWVKATPTTPGEVGAYSQSAGAGLAGRLTTAETTITQTATEIQSKADQTEVDTVKGTVSGHTTTLSQHATAIASKAESSLVNTIKGTVDTHTTEISQNATDIASKASSSSVNTLTGRVSTAESDISQNATAISQRVTTTTYNAGIASKENSVLKQSAAPSHLNGRLWLDTSVTPNILKRSTGTSWVKATPTTASEVGAYSSGQGNALAGRVTTAETNITQTATAIESKADQTEVDTVKGTVSGHTTTLSQHATAIASKAESSLVNTIKGTVDTHTTEISQNATAIASKASSSSVSTLTGRVSTAETTITQHATSIASKASQTEVDTVKGTVSGHTSTLSQHASQISARLTSSQVNTLVDNKGFSTVNYVDNQITASANGIKADMTRVEGKIDGLEVGGRNLLKDSSTEKKGLREYLIYGNIAPIFDEHGVGQYTFSFDIKLDVAGVIQVYCTDRGNDTIKYRFSPRNFSATTEYKRYSMTVDVDVLTSTANHTSLAFYGTYDTGRIPSVKNVKIEKGNIATDWTPAPEDTMMENDFNVFKASYEATAEALTTRLTAVDKAGGRLATAETKITQNATAISSKANTSTVNTLTGRVSTAETNISQNATAISSKASQTEVNTVKGTVSGHTTTLSQHATAIASKAESSLVNTIKGTVDTHTTEISQNATAIASKASSSSVNTLTGRVSTAESTITQHATSIASKASQTEVDTVKGTVSGHTSTLSQHASQISARLTSTQVNSLVDGKGLATSTYVDNQITATATGIRTDLTKVEGKIDGLQVGGRNLLRNSDVYSQWGGTFTVESKEGHESIHAKSLSTTRNWININTSNHDEAYDVGTTLTLSGWFYVDSSVPMEAVNDFYVRLGDGSLAGWHDMLGINLRDIEKDKWVHAHATYTLDYRNTLYQLGLGLAKASVYFRDIKLEKGNVATDWSPAPEDTVMESDFTVFKNSYQNTVDAINTELSKTAKKTDLNGMVTESVLSTKNFVTAGSMTTTLASYAKTDGVPTKTQFNTLKNSYDSMVQTIGTNGSKIAQMVMTDSAFRTTVADQDILSRAATGLQLSSDPTFLKGVGGVTRYDRSGAGVSIARENPPTGTQPNGPYRLRIVSTGGGIAKYTASGANKEFLIKFTANLPKGIEFRDASNLLGDGSQGKWLTSKEGTGTWTEYAYYYKCGSSGTFGTFGHLYVPSSTAVTWYLSKHEIFDITGTNQTQITQLADSWALTIKSGNDIKTQINASTDNIRLHSKFIYLSGQSAIEDAVIKSAHIDTLNANKIVGNTADFNKIRTGVLTADAVTATHIKADTALFDTLFSTTSATDRLVARGAWIENANIKNIDASKITAGTINAARISTSSLANLNIGGTNLLKSTSNKFKSLNLTPWYVGVDGGERSALSTYGLSVGDTVTFRVYIKSTSGHGGSTRLTLFKADGTYTIFLGNSIRNGQNGYSVVTATIPSDRTELNVGINNDINPGVTSSTVQYKEPKLEKGNKATDWSPAPEDIVNDLGTRGSVEIHGGNIKADTLDVGAITGNTATFLSTGFKSLNSQATINGHAIRIQNSAGEFVEMNNTPELRSDDAGGTAVVLGKGRVHFYDSRGYSKGYVGTDMHTAGSYDFGTFLSKGSGIYKFARMADATQTTYAYYTVKAGLTAPASVITNMVQNGYLPDGNPQQFVAKGNMLSQLNGWPAYPNWPALSAGQQIRYKELTTQTTGDAYEDIWKFGPSSQGDWRIYFAKHATFEGGTTGTSDRRLKHDIETTQVEALHHIESLAFKEFRWNRDNKYEPLGLIAQDSGIVRVADDDMEGIDIQRAIMLGLKGIQELQAVVKEQAEEIKQLKEIINQ